MSTRFVGNRNTSPANRVGDARNRRSQRSEERASSAARRVVTPVQTRPVTSRGNLFGTPIHKQAGTKRARRQFYVAMDQPGAELRLPAIPLVNPGWRLLSSLIVIAVLVGIYSLWNSPYFQIEAVEVKGLTRIDPAEMTDKLGLVEASIIEVDQAEIMDTLRTAYPELINVQVDVELPNYVTISAEERQPVLAWQQGDQVSWLDAEGVLFPARGDAGALVTVLSETAPPLAPVPASKLAAESEQLAAAEDAEAESKVAVPAELPKADTLVLQAAQALSQKLPPETTIVYHAQHGLGWNDPMGSQIFIGKDLQSFETKYAMYEAISAQLANQGLQPVIISVEHVNAPFYRLEQ